MGDSITAGFGLNGAEGFLDEFRGQSFPIGGDVGAPTVFNFIKHFNPNVFGSSVGSHLVELPGEAYYPSDGLNAAQSNADSTNYDYQIQHILDVISGSSVNISEWKLFNILMGANDACPICEDNPLPSVQKAAADYKTRLGNAIQLIYSKIPKVIVNILPMFNVSGVYELTRNSTYCFIFHDVIPVECPCAFSSDINQRTFMDDVLTAYREKVVELSNEWRAKNLPDFSVIYQPFTTNLKIPSLAYLSTLDCFHPSKLAHQSLAIATWNSLITPFAKKKTTWDPSETLQCPTASSRIFTS
eukprot:TRINITY_DN5058_c0_g1_i1.p1 TRINITY_DN5058_c0_g1~~TRINITY_DN5058_c0_g1_i1.p1  ORF type:complete len:300 (-),score=32.57 TRINITY_DN5058_c0_g1_i1:15-914(-)